VINMKTGKMRARLARAILATLICGTAASAAELDYRVSVGAASSDNVRRSRENEIDETIGIAQLQLSLDQRTNRVRADIFSDLAYYEYLDDTFDSEVVGNVYADTAFSLVPDRFIWSASDQFGQVLVDPLQPSTADNRENINYFSTGPDFIVGASWPVRLQFGGRYALTEYEDSPLDMSSTAAQVALVRSVSEGSSISLNGRIEQIEYKEQSLDADFDQLEAYLHYQVAGSRTNLSLDAGFAQLRRDFNDEKENGALLDVEMSRRLSGSSTLQLGAGRRFSTAAGAFIAEQGIGDGGIGGGSGRQTASPFTRDHVTLGWAFRRNRTGLYVDLSWTQRTYEGLEALDQSSVTFATRYSRDLSPRATLGLGVAYGSADYEPPAADNKDLTFRSTLTWRLTRNVSLEARYDFVDRNSTAPLTEYSENRFWVTIGYGHGEPRSQRSSPSFGIDTLAPRN
jgi:hypothetical protein